MTQADPSAPRATVDCRTSNPWDLSERLHVDLRRQASSVCPD